MSRRGYERLALSLCLATALLALAGCRKDKAAAAQPAPLSSAEAAQRASSARQSLDELKPKLSALDAAVAALHREFDPLPPGLPDFGPTRSKFYATAEGVGMLGTQVVLLSQRLQSAERVRDGAELAAIAKEISRTNDELRKASGLASELLHEVQPFKSAVEQPFGPPTTKCE